MQAPAILLVRVLLNAAAGIVVGVLEASEELRALWHERQ